MKLYKFSNHSLSLAYWLKNLSLSKTYYLLHIDKHSDLLSPKRSDNINSGNFLFHFFLTDINIKKMFWIYPDYFHKDENYQKLLSLEIKEIFNNISIYFKNANIKKTNFSTVISTKKKQIYFLTAKNFNFIRANNYIIDIDCDYFCCLKNNEIFINISSIFCILDIISKIRDFIDIITIAYSYDGGYLPPQLAFIGDFIELEIYKMFNICDYQYKYYQKMFDLLFKLNINKDKCYIDELLRSFKEFSKYACFKLNYFEYKSQFVNNDLLLSNIFEIEKFSISLEMLRVNGFGYYYESENILDKSINKYELTLRYDKNNIYIILKLLNLYKNYGNINKFKYYLSLFAKKLNLNIRSCIYD